MESPFEVLHLDADADEEEIEQAYRDRVKQAHPDQGGSVEEFQTVRRAYEKIKAGYSPNGASAETTTDQSRDGARDEQNRAQSDQRQAQDGQRQAQAQQNREQEETQRDVRVSSEVTFLNYDTLTDFGWNTDDENLFEKAADADLDEVDFGQFVVEPGQSLLEAAEDHEFAWPFACRGGACANCAIMLLDGELSMPASHVLPSEMMERGIRLSCNAVPITTELKVVYNVKHMPELEDLLLPPDPFEHAYSD